MLGFLTQAQGARSTRSGLLQHVENRPTIAAEPARKHLFVAGVGWLVQCSDVEHGHSCRRRRLGRSCESGSERWRRRTGSWSRRFAEQVAMSVENVEDSVCKVKSTKKNANVLSIPDWSYLDTEVHPKSP